MSAPVAKVLLILAAVSVSGNAFGQSDAMHAEQRIANTDIIGNTVTREDLIRKCFSFVPGQKLCYSDLRIAEGNLVTLGIFEANAETGVKPTIEVLPQHDPDSPVHHLPVHVQ